MTRREAAEKVFNYIRENKFEPINIQYGNGYFIFDMGDIRHDEKEKSYHCNNCGSRNLGKT